MRRLRSRFTTIVAAVSIVGGVAGARLDAQITDFNGYITTENWLVLGPFNHVGLACSGDSGVLLGNHIGPSELHCQYPEASDPVEYDPAQATTSGYAGPLDGDGMPFWRPLEGQTPGGCNIDLDVDAGAGDDNQVLSLMVTYVEYIGANPTTIDICANSDDDQQVWWNDQLAINEAACRPQGDCNGAVCNITASVNVEPKTTYRILHIIFENGGGWAGSLRLLDGGVQIDDGIHPDWVFHGIEPPGDAPPCVPLPQRTLQTGGDPNGCPPSAATQIDGNITQAGGDAGEVVTVEERVTGDFGPADVTVDNGGTVAAIPQAAVSPVGQFADHRNIVVTPACSPSNGDTVEGPPGTYTMTNTGEDIWTNGDTFQFAYNVVQGDFDVTVHVVSRTPSIGNRWGKHGIMARQSLDPRSRYSWTHDAIGDITTAPQNNDDSTRHASRPNHLAAGNFEMTPFATNPSGDGIDDYCDGQGPDDGVGCFDFTCPDDRELGGCVVHDDYLRLVRVGSVFESYSRADPADPWTFLGSHDWGAGAPNEVLVGLAVTSHSIDCGSMIEIVFDEMDYGGATIVPVTLPDIGVDMEWNVARSVLQTTGVSYTIDRSEGNFVFNGNVEGTSTFGTGSLSLTPPVTDQGPFSNGLEHGHNIGAPCPGTGFDDDGGGGLTIHGAGEDIWANGDQFMFAYSEVTGDFRAEVTITEQIFAPGSRWGKHGIMARQDCSVRSRYSFIHDQGEDLQDATRFATRPNHEGAGNFETPGPLPAGSHFFTLRLERVGSEVIGSVFDDQGLVGPIGEWQEVSRHDWGQDIPDSLQVGLAVTSHNGPCNVTSITFEDWELTVGTPPQPPSNLNCEAQADGSIDVSWTLPGGPSGPIRISVGGTEIQTLNADATSTTIAAGDVTSDADGIATIAATNDEGTGRCAVFTDDELYINCGGDRLDDALGTGIGDGRVWFEDTLANPSPFLVSPNSNTANFGGGLGGGLIVDTILTEPDFIDDPLGGRLFPSERWANADVEYSINLPRGNYEVVLLFMEGCCSDGCEDLPDPADSAGGCRVFDVSINGKQVADQFAQHVEAHRGLAALDPPLDTPLPNTVYGIGLTMGPIVVCDTSRIQIFIDDLGSGNPPENASIKGIAIRPLSPGGGGNPCVVGEQFVRGDSDQNQNINLTDGVHILRFLFVQGAATPGCLDASDSDDMNPNNPNLTDGVFVFLYLFAQGATPPPPSPSMAAGFTSADCGPDPTPDDGISCLSPPDYCN